MNTRNTFPVISVARLLTGLAVSAVGLFFCGASIGRTVIGSYEPIDLAISIIATILCVALLSHAVLSLVFLLIDMHDQSEHVSSKLQTLMREKYQG